MKLIAPQKHFIPGYTGHCPQYENRTIEPSKTNSNRKYGDISKCIINNFDFKRPSFQEIGLIKRHKIYKNPMLPGYSGFIPYINEKFGSRYSKAAATSIDNHKKNSQDVTNDRQLLQYKTFLQKDPANDYGYGMRESNYKYKYKLPNPITNTWDDNSSLVENNIINRNDNNYCQQQENNFELFPITTINTEAITDDDKNLEETNDDKHFKYEIYLKNSGLMPYYTGHVPGEIFRFGSTFGKDTVNAKRWLSKN